MADISRKTYEGNSIQTESLEESLDHKNVRKITEKCYSGQRKYKSELVEEPKKQINRISIDKKLAIQVIMDCRTTSAHKFRTRLAFKQYHVILTKEQ